MCILCVASRWSRRIATMLPWLVIPLIILWALSQLLPPGFRFEVTSPRLACVAVLLVSLGWYELVMPRFSAWRARRRALLKERRRIEAQEVAKWRKEATRRCRNCFTPYKDQTPGGGRFMCTYCGHVSKRPVLDVPGGATSARSSFSLTGSAAGFLNGGGSFKIWNGRGSQDRPSFGGGRGWMAGRPWTDGGSWGVNGSWFGGSWPGNALYFGTAGPGWAGAGTFIGGGIFGGERCSAGESYFGFFWFLLRVLSHLLVCVVWIWRKLWRAGYPGEDGMDGVHRACHPKGEDAGPLPETRGEKARRKAEEKRLARLEKEQLEAEERKQREEVARLVEERRRQRDEKLEAEKVSEREAAAEREREIRREREAEKRRQEKAREREKVPAKEKSKDQDSEELKRKKGKENEKKTDTEKNEGEDLKAASINTSESGKNLKPTKLDTSLKGNEAGVKIAANHSSKWGSSKYLGSAKSGFFSQSKNVAASINSATSFWGRSFSTGSNPAGKSSKAAIPGMSSSPSTSNPSTGSSGKCVEVSGSAWNRIAWTNVWGKAASKVRDDASKKLKVVENTDKKSEPSGNDGVKKDLIDGTVVSASTGGVSQQPIAPPSSLSDSWDNLFSGPLCFPPVELPVDSVYQEQRQTKAESKIHHVPFASSSSSSLLLSSELYFGASASMALPCTQVSMSCICSDAINPATSSSLPPSVSSSLNMIDFPGADIHDSLSLLGPLSDSLISSSGSDLGTTWNPLSPLDASPPLPKDSEFTSANQNDLLQILEPWNVPLLSVDGTKDNRTEGIWHHWGAPQPRQINFSEPSPWDAPFQHGNDPPFQHGNDPLQPFSPTILQPNFEPESHLPSSLFSSEQQDGSFKPPYGESSCSTPIPGSSNWLDSSAVESIMRVWEDTDIYQRVPPDFVDCITHSLMQDPVITADGHSYERSAIEAWLKSHDTSPKTGEVLPPPPGGNGAGVDKTLRPNHILRGQIIEYRERLARGFGSHQGIMKAGWNTAAAGVCSSSWSPKGSTTMRPPIRGIYPTPGVESLWSYNVSGG